MMDKSNQPTGSPQEASEARFLRNLLILVFLGMILLFVPMGFLQNKVDWGYLLAIGLPILVVLIASLVLLNWKITWPARVLVPLVVIITISIHITRDNGLHNTLTLGYLLAVIASSFTLGKNAPLWTGLLAVLATAIIGVLEMNGVIKTPLSFSTSWTTIAIPSLIIMASALAMRFLVQRQSEAIKNLKSSDEEQREANRQLLEIRDNLEARIQERTTELTSANERNARRAVQFEAIAKIARAVTAIRNFDALLSELVRLMSEQFGFYHVGIFLLDDAHQYAILQASSSEGGKRMLARGHNLRVGQVGVVGYAAGTGRPRIALNVGMDAVFSRNPDLPDTRSEMALPLLYDQEIIGVLDIQSTSENAFSDEDVSIFSALAGQISVAIKNVSLFEESQRMLAKSQKAVGGYLEGSWQGLRSIQPQLGYRISGNRIRPLDRPLDTPQVQQAMEKGITVAETSQKATFASLSIPIRLRDRVIGVMDIRVPKRREWEQDYIDIAEAVAQRLSIAIETATLLKTTQVRAEFERTTSDISSRISSTTRIDSILRTAAEELSHVLGDSEVLVQIQPTVFEQPPAKE